MEALNRFVVGLKRFAASNHHANLYHETITWAFVLIINERIERFGANHTWSEFEEQNSDVIEDGRAVLGGFYSSEVIESNLARRVFLMPDRAPNDQSPDPVKPVAGSSAGPFSEGKLQM